MRALALLVTYLGCSLFATATLADERPWFVDATLDVGLELPSRPGSLHEDVFALAEIMGSGLAVFDFDGDGDLDVFLVRDADDRPRLFENDLEHSGAFVDGSANLPSVEGGMLMGAAVGDVDNDGDLDLFLTGFGTARLWLNGPNRFEDASARLGAIDPVWGASAAFCDLDLDGDLDLVVTNYVRADARSCPNAAGEPDFCPPNAFAPVNDTILTNRGDGAFESATFAGTARAGLGLVCFDIDGDGAIEVAVANDGQPNQLWSPGDAWQDDAVARGFAVNIMGEDEAGMGVALADVQNDGALDLFVTHIDVETNTLWIGERGRFFDETSRHGLAKPSVGTTGFGVAAFDADRDGDVDLAIANGKVRRRVGSEPSRASYAEPNLLLENRDGRFYPRCMGDAFCSSEDIGRGLVARDLDGDGALDLVTSDNEGRLRFFRNVSGPSRWVGIRAWDGVRDAVGALVRIVDERLPPRSRPVLHTTSYLSSRDAATFFGLGKLFEGDHVGVEVTWPDGFRESFLVEVDRLSIVVRGEGEAAAGLE